MTERVKPERGETLYVKRNKRYVPVYEAFVSFPANGVWYVKSGTMTRTVPPEYLGDVDRMIDLSLLRRHELHCLDAISTLLGRRRVSPNEIWRAITDTLARREATDGGL